MAKKQTRRTVSINRAVFEAAKQEAAHRGVALSALVESALAAFGISTAAPSQFTDRRPSRERQVLGDLAAEAYGFR